MSDTPSIKERLREVFQQRRYGAEFEYDPDFDLFDVAAEEIERLEHNQITASHTSIAQAAAIQAQHASASMREADAQMQRADELDAKCTAFTNALMRSMSLIDELLRENARLCAASDDPPNVRLFAAKASFDTAMHKLLGDSEITTESDTSNEGEAK